MGYLVRYNLKRLHSYNGYETPVAMEEKLRAAVWTLTGVQNYLPRSMGTVLLNPDRTTAREASRIVDG